MKARLAMLAVLAALVAIAGVLGRSSMCVRAPGPAAAPARPA
jgi:hypothetical protein